MDGLPELGFHVVVVTLGALLPSIIRFLCNNSGEIPNNGVAERGLHLFRSQKLNFSQF